MNAKEYATTAAQRERECTGFATTSGRLILEVWTDGEDRWLAYRPRVSPKLMGQIQQAERIGYDLNADALEARRIAERRRAGDAPGPRNWVIGTMLGPAAPRPQGTAVAVTRVQSRKGKPRRKKR